MDETPGASPTANRTGPAPLRWGPERRLRIRSEFKTVYERGRRFRGRGLVLFRMPRGGEGIIPWRLGVTVTRQAGGSVARNRLRRIIREYFRTNQWELSEGWDMVVNAGPELRKMQSAEIREELQKILIRAGANTSGGAE